MRRLMLGGILVPAALLAGCGADTIQGPAPREAALSVERQDEKLARTFDFTTFDVPGAVVTAAQGINARGDIVGSYVDAGRHRHGFLMRDGDFTTIDFPDAASTDARGIGPGGDIVGGYQLPGEPGVNIHGYRLTKHGTFVTVDYPGHTNTIPQRILPDGTILGCRHDENTMDTMRGVVMASSGNQELDVMASMNNGATPDGRRITGLYTPMGKPTAGYVVEDGVFTPFRVVTDKLTAAWDMNPAGEIAGVYADAANRVHGFVRSGDEYVTLDVPGANATRAFGINARGDVVGSYVTPDNKVHGFLATPGR